MFLLWTRFSVILHTCLSFKRLEKTGGTSSIPAE